MFSSRPKTTERTFASIDEWVARELIPFSISKKDKAFDAAVDRMMESLGDQVSILGIGEPIHSGEEFLVLRNRLFQRLVEAHGFRAITIETNDMRARLVDAYIQGRGPATFEGIQDSGFSVGIGHWNSNRELVEWLRQYNADPAHTVKLNLYGTLASDQETTESPRQALEFALAYLTSVDPAAAAGYREIVTPLLGADADWVDAATALHKEIMERVLAGNTDTGTSSGDEIGISPRAQALRLAVENLAFELQVRRPELVSKSNRDAYGEAARHVMVARNLLALHEAEARRESLDTLVTMRDAMAGEHLAYVAEREQPRGKVLVFLHSIHLRRTQSTLPWYTFWPTGAHLDQMFGSRFAVIGGAIGTSEPNFVGPPEAGSLEARLLAHKSDGFLPTGRGRRLAGGALAALPVRSGSKPWIPYTPLVAQAVSDFDVIAFLRNVTYTRGLPPQPS